MGEIASRAQLRWSYLRWAFVTVPFVMLLGFASARTVPVGSRNDWYRMLEKPPGTPPDWLFPVAWTAIYIVMGLALAMIVNARGSRVRGLAIALFAAQLLVNLLWTPLFFGAHRVVAALVVIVIMFVLALATTLLFGRIRNAAAWLMVPYLAWLAYAALLNLGIAWLNPHAQSLVPQTLVPSSITTQISG